MAFEIVLTRSPLPGYDYEFDKDAPPLSLSEFELVMDGAPIRRRLEDGSIWLWHPMDMAWLSASFIQMEMGKSYILFSVSYSHNQFLKVFADAIELALRLSRQLGARVFGDSGAFEISMDNADELLLPHSDLVKEQVKLWKDTVARMDASIEAPLEYPLGPYDGVRDYFVFFLELQAKFEASVLVEKLQLAVVDGSLNQDRFAIKDPETDAILSRVVLRPNDGALQIWPFYWMEEFSIVAKSTMALALKLQEELGGKLFLQEKEFTPELKSEVEKHIDGLGVEFFLWLNGEELSGFFV